MTVRNSIGFTAYLAIVLILILTCIEFISLKINRSNNINLPFMYQVPQKYDVVGGGDKFHVIDPHLGYAHGAGDSKLDEQKKQYTWVDGFVIYKKQDEKIERPIILTLGGSTTDGVSYGHSWPEHLARILHDKALPGTVVNGGTGGYSTNQELLKLIRDGLTFKPDIVISFSGVNDRGFNSMVPYHMVHLRQMQILDSLTKRKSRFMPNFVALANRKIANPDKDITYTMGVKSNLSLAEQYERNIILMNSITRTYGGDFFAFIQPNANWKSKHSANAKKKPEYTEAVIALYKDITKIPSRRDFCHDFTQIFESHEKVFKEDGTHATDGGDKIIADEVFKVVKNSVELRKPQ